MKNLVRMEELMLFVFGVYLFTGLNYAWWVFAVLLFVPDLGMLGYMLNNEVGAYVYNIVHHRALSIALYIAGSLLQIEVLMLAGVILFAHSSLDRVFDYGFKYPDDFKHTHLSERAG